MQAKPARNLSSISKAASSASPSEDPEIGAADRRRRHIRKALRGGFGICIGKVGSKKLK